MRTGICPKCKSHDILVFEADSDKEGKVFDCEKLGVLGGKIYTSRYVCCNCGYTERYFEDVDLDKLRKKFKKVRG